MAITYLNRLLAIGSPARVTEFRDTMRTTLLESLGKRAWMESAPFSLATLNKRRRAH
jgi:hypothetical protein